MNRYELLPSYYYDNNTDGFLVDSVGKFLRDYKIYGNSVQEGIPTSDTPIEIQSVGDKIINLVDVDYLLEQNPTDTTTLERVLYNDRDTLKYIAGSKGSSFKITPREGFKENTRYTIRLEAASSSGSFDLIVKFTDDTSKYLRLSTLVKNYVQGTFREIMYVTPKNKTVQYISGAYNDDQNVYIDISKFQIIEGFNYIDYTGENSSVYKVGVKSPSKNIANLEQIYNFATEIDIINEQSIMRTYIYVDESNRKVLANYCATGYGKDGYTENRKVFQGIFKENTQYTISFQQTSTAAAVNLFIHHTDGTNVSMTNPNYTDSSTIDNISITSASGKTVDYIGLTYKNGTNHIYLDTFQIEEGALQTSYEPYGQYNILLTEPLRKIGDYVDYIDFKKQKVVRSVNVVDTTGYLTLEESLENLDEPTEESVVLPKILTLKGDVNISVQVQVEPSRVEYQYYRGGK